jgi:hypothetical protein
MRAREGEGKKRPPLPSFPLPSTSPLFPCFLLTRRCALMVQVPQSGLPLHQTVLRQDGGVLSQRHLKGRSGTKGEEERDEHRSVNVCACLCVCVLACVCAICV